MQDHMNLFTKIELSYDKFSKGQKRIADFILNHYDKAAFYTAAKLGNEVGVSESTVVRFAYELEYEGYPELQKAVAAMVRTHSNSIQRLESAANRMDEENLLEAMLKEDRVRIKETAAGVSSNDFNRVVDEIANAKNIYILGVRSTWYLAGMLGYYFRMIFDNVHVLEGNGNVDALEEICRINENDIFIGISFPRYSIRTVKALEFAKKNGAKTVSITDSMQSPMIPFSDYPLIAKSEVVAIVDSLTAPLSLINALIVAVCMKKKVDLESRLHILEDLWKEYKVYDDRVVDENGEVTYE